MDIYLVGVCRHRLPAEIATTRIAQGFGSTVETTGDLIMGNASALAGFTSDGELNTRNFTVTMNDANEAVLGPLTKLGKGADGTDGTLIAGAAGATDFKPDFFVEEGKNFVGRGHVQGDFKNNGHVIGDGTSFFPNQRIIFDAPWRVTGKGTFDNHLVLGTFAGGESPGVTDGTNQAFGGIVEIELGGLTPGDGENHHDQIIEYGTLELPMTIARHTTSRSRMQITFCDSARYAGATRIGNASTAQLLRRKPPAHESGNPKGA